MPEFDLALLAVKFPWSTLLQAFLASVTAILLLVPVARHIGWVDKPNSRKSHEGEIPLIGGWAIVLSLLIMQLVGAGQAAPAGFWIGALLLFAVAMIDDRYPVRARYRLLVQITAAVAGVSLGGTVLPDLGDLLGMGVLSSWWIVAPVSVLGTVALINAVNFTDGVDGLCGGLGFIGFFWFLIAVAVSNSYAVTNGDAPAVYAFSLVPLAAAMMGGVAGFLVFNLRRPGLPRALVFMGDSGSTVVGFTLAWFAIHVTSAFGDSSVPPVVCLWIMAVPLADSASCIVRRAAEGVPPMRADLKHLHHLLRTSGLSIGQSVLAIYAGSFACGLIGVTGWWLHIADRWLFAGFVGAVMVFVGVTNLAWRRIEVTQGLAQAELSR